MIFNAQQFGQTQNVTLTLALVLVGAPKTLTLLEKPEMDGSAFLSKTKGLEARHPFTLFVHYQKGLALKLLSMIQPHSSVHSPSVAPLGRQLR